jgi:hypothetical protein
VPCIAPVYSEASRLFSGARNADDRKARDDCDQVHRRAHDVHTADTSRKIEEVREKWMRDNTLIPDNCTSISDTLLCVASASRPIHAALLSDGLETCETSKDVIPPPPAGSRVVIILLATKEAQSKSLAHDFLIRKQRLAAKAPWATIVAPWEFTPDLLTKTR